MQIKTSSNSINIIGNIKSVSDYQEIKTAVDLIIKNSQNIVITIEDSLSITSSIIGYFNKLVLKDKIDISMKIGNAQLVELLDDLSLMSVFKVSKI